MPLTDTLIKNVKATDKTQKISDGKGLYLEVPSKGNKRWRLRYRINGVEKLISLGVYPDVGLKDARDRRDEARKQIVNQIDPSAARKAEKATVVKSTANAFEAVAREFVEKKRCGWAESHIRTIYLRLENLVFPFIGSRPVEEITPPELLVVLRKIEDRDTIETAHRVRGLLGQIFRYAISTARVISDPARDLRGALQPVVKKHLAAITDPPRVAQLLNIIDGYKGSRIVSVALRLAPLVFVRPGELRQAEWKDIDFETAEWRFTAYKTYTPHIVPLSTQAIAIIKEIQPLTGRGRYVFPSARSFDRPMSNNAVLAALRSMGVPSEEMCGHGFRAMARTILDEVLGFRPDLIEHQLAHAVRDPLGRAYNRTKHLPERKEMMQKWANYLDELKKG